MIRNFEGLGADPQSALFASTSSDDCERVHVRKGEAGERRLFAFPTTEANDVVWPMHAKAIVAQPA